MVASFGVSVCFVVFLAIANCRGKEIDLLSAIRSGHPRIWQTSTTVTVTETVMRTERLRSTVCAKLINVTGSCHLPNLRNGIAGEEPVVLTFDDDMDQFETVDALFHIQPSKTLAVETTVAPTGFDEDRDAKFRLEASMSEPDSEESQLRGLTKPKTFFHGTIIFRETVRITSVISLPPRETKTVFFMNCTPYPFTALSICLSRKRNTD